MLMLSFVALSALAAKSSHEPKWLDWTLAGYALDSGENHHVIGIYDRSTGYYLTRSIECDGADITLVLTKDRNVVRRQGYVIPGFKPKDNEYYGQDKLVLKKLPSLRTGKGLAIGDSPQKVRGTLGKPLKIRHEGARNQYLVYSYEWTDKSIEELPPTYSENYTFKAGHLIEISFAKGGE